MVNILYTVIIYPIIQIFEFVFVFAQKIFKETGLSVIFISAAVSVLCLPLYMVAERWQIIERNIQKMLAPKVSKIKAAFSGDERYMILSTYYRQNHYHPIYAMRSSFGLLIQVPFFIAAYSYLSQLQALQGMSFLFINDLGKPDALIPFMGGINLLPVLMTLINCAAGAIYTRGLGIRDKVQIYGMALVFLILLYNTPAGLVLYWTLNNLFSLIKEGYLKCSFKNKKYILFGIISALAFLLLFYILFIHHGNTNIRVLIAVLSLIVGILPWITPFIFQLTKKIKHISWAPKENFIILIFSLFILWIVTGIFLPSMLIGSSPQEFSFVDNNTSPFPFIFNVLLQSIGIFILWPLCIYCMCPVNIRNILAKLSAALAAIAVVNVFLFPGKYGFLTLFFTFSESPNSSPTSVLLNLLVVAFVAILTFVFANRFRKIMVSGLIIALCAFALSGIINLKRIYNEFQSFQLRRNSEQFFTDEPVYQFSRTGKNVLVIMLDRAISGFVYF